VDQYSVKARRLTIWFTLMTTFAVFSLLPFSKIRFTPVGLEALGYFFVVMLSASAYCWKRKMVRLAPSLEAVALGILLTVPILVSTYLAASLNLPLVDDELMRADTALGFDWMAFIKFVDAHSVFAQVLAGAYGSFAIQLLVLPLILGATGHYGRSYTMILAYGVLCYISSVVSIWFPALGTYASQGVGQDQLQHINAMYGFHFLSDFMRVREEPEFLLSMANASGIITFPSVHAAGAFLCAWAAWSLKPVRYFFVVWNALMAVSAVSHGSHYVIDVVAGFVISAVSIFIALQALRRTAHIAPSTLLSSPILSFSFRRKQRANRSEASV